MALQAVREAQVEAVPDTGDVLVERLGGDLPPGLHEVFAAGDDVGAGLGFAAMLAARCRRGGPVFWLREDRSRRGTRLYGWGLAELGLAAERLILIETTQSLAALRAAREVLGCSSAAAMVMETRGKVPALDLTATRRLHLAAMRSGVLAISLRLSAEICPSAALTRWQVMAAPSRPLPALAPGPARLVLSLQRHRGGVADFEMAADWDPEVRGFVAADRRTTPLPVSQHNRRAPSLSIQAA